MPQNLISEKERKSNLKKWDAYQNKLLFKHKEVIKERKKKEKEQAKKIDQEWDDFQKKRFQQRQNEVLAKFKHRVDLIMEYV